MALACPKCDFELKPAFLESPDFRGCQICGSEISVLPFRGLFESPATIGDHELRRAEEETSCFHHDSKRAVTACSRCGKFLCALCSVDVGGDVLCPECIVSGQRKGTDSRLEGERVLYDSLALTLAVLPALTISFSIFGAPAAIYVALRYWKRPTSIVRRFAWRKYVALTIGLAQIGFWIFVIIVGALAPRPAAR